MSGPMNLKSDYLEGYDEPSTCRSNILLQSDLADNGKIIKIEISHCQFNIPKSRILRQFSKFGRIKRIIPDEDKLKHYLIEFYRCESVNEVLRCRSYPFAGHTMSLDIDPPIILLEDQILVQIFMKLQTKDRENLAYAHKRFYEVYQECLNYTQMLKEIDTSMMKHPQLYSSLIERNINDPDIGKRGLELFNEHISCFGFQGTLQNLQNLKYLSNINTLKLSSRSLNDADILVIQQFLPKIKILYLNKNSKLTGRYLSELISLHELSLADCNNITNYHLIEIFRSHNNLKKLNLKHCELSTTVLNEMYANLECLECLAITCTEPIEYIGIAAMPKLKCLEIIVSASCQPEIKRLMDMLKYSRILESLDLTNIYTSFDGMHSQNQLKRLRVRGHPMLYLQSLHQLKNLESIEFDGSMFSEIDLLMIFQKCPKLKHVAKGVFVLTKELILKIIDVLEKEPQERENPVLFRVDDDLYFDSSLLKV